MNITYTLADLPEVANAILSHAPTKTLLFYGELGIGKTTLIKELAKSLGIEDTLTSPTFSIINEYQLDADKLYHFDFYRIEEEEEAMDLGIEEYFHAGHWNFIEWPQKITNLLPEDSTELQLSKNLNGSRTLKMMPVN